MGKVYFLLSFLFIFGYTQVDAQKATGGTTKLNNKGYKVKWKATPFDHQVFIANQGQFNESIPGKEKIVYAAQLGDVWAYFTAHGIVYCYKKFPADKDPDKGGEIKPVIHYTSSNWVNSETSTIETADEQSYYYTYPNGANATIKTSVYKKITYRNLYPGIDIEYTFPKGKPGFEYSIIVHSGADISAVKLNYANASSLKLNKEGDAIITSNAGTFTEHAPTNFSGLDGNTSAFIKVNGNTESFVINGTYDKSKTIVIDPWVTNPLFTPTYDRAYDLDYDYKGNVYAFGSYQPYQLEKFNSNGTPQWVFNASGFNAFGSYGDVVDERKSGTVYITEGFDFSGAKAMKVNTNGLLVATFPGNNSLNEFWRAAYNACFDNIVIGAGGTGAPNQACMLDTNMISVTPVNVLSAGSAFHDMVLLAPDPSGVSCYMATSQVAPFNNKLIQVPLPTLSPTSYIVSDNFNFQEANVPNYVGPGASNANGYDGMAVSPNWLYIYNSATLNRIVKATGIVNNSILVDNAVIINGKTGWGGLAVDPLDNLYVGCKDSIKIYNPSMVFDTALYLKNNVYDVVLSLNNTLYACGDSFVCQIAIPNLPALITSAVGSPSSCAACNGTATVTVNYGVAPFSFQWSNGSTNQTDTGLCAGVYKVFVTDASCPARQDTATVVVGGPGNITATVVDSNPDCGFKKGNITIFPSGGSAPYTFAWSNGATNQKDTGLVAGTYTCTVTDNVGCKYIVSAIIVNPSVPTVIISPSHDSICHGGNAILTASGAKTYTWNPGNHIGNSINVSPVVTTTYTVNALDSNGCSASATVTVVVNHPVISINPPTDTLCAGSSVNLLASGATTYSWTPAVGLSCYNCSNPTANPASTQTWKVIGTDNHGCTDTTNVTVVVSPLPLPGITVSPANDTICIGDSAKLTGSGGGSYFWPVPNSHNNFVWVKPASTTTYQLQVTQAGCTAFTTQKVTVLPQPAPTLTLRNNNICPNDSTYIVAAGGVTYKWSNNGSTADSIKVKPGTTTTYTVFISSPCGKDTLTKTLTIDPLPVVSTSHDTSICAGSHVVLSASGGNSYLWTAPSSTNSSISVNPAITTTYTVVVSNGQCTKDTTITVTVVSKANGNITPPTDQICEGAPVTLNASGGGTYKWSTGATTSTITVNPSSNTTYTVIVSKGCPDTASASITVFPTPNLTACCDHVIVIDSSVGIVASGASSYQWIPNDGSLSCVTCPNPTASPTVTTTYTVITRYGNGCTVEDTVTIYVDIPCADFVVPNVFTPNNDGINDDFVIKVTHPSSYSISIYDRWGKEMYTSTNPNAYWNGRILNTQNVVPDGVYYYIIKASCGSNNYNKKGFVQVVGEE